MEEQKIKEGLWQLTKGELVEIFKSLELKVTSNKELLVNAILEGSATEEEIADFKIQLELKGPVYIVMHPIHEDDTKYKRGDEYAGKNVELLLKYGQIRLKD